MQGRQATPSRIFSNRIAVDGVVSTGNPVASATAFAARAMLNCARAITPAPRAFRRSAAATTDASCAAPLPALSASIASATNSVCNVEVDGNSGGIDTNVGANDAMSPMHCPD